MGVPRGALVGLAVVLGAVVSADAQAVASVLELASPEAQRAAYQPLQFAAGPTGQIMVVYKALGADGAIVPVSLVRRGAGP